MTEAERGNRLRRVADRWVGCPLVMALGLFRKRRACPEEPKRIGILMFGAIGDALLASAITHDLHRAIPQGRVIAFASVGNGGILELVQGLDETVVMRLDQPFTAIGELRRRNLDLLIDVGQWPRISAVMAALSNARFTVGFKTRGQSRHWAFDVTADHSSDRHELDNFRALLSCLGIRAVGVPVFKAGLFEELRRPKRERFIIFHPWASGYRSHLREWAISNWARLGAAVLDRGFRIVVTGGPEDQDRAEGLAEAIGARDRTDVMAGRTSLWDTAVILMQASAVIAVNTGVMHMSALLDRPTLALHGPTNPERWGPIGKSCTVIGPGPECGCAYLNLGFEYPRDPPDCMGKISVQEVLDALDTVLARIAP